MNAHHSGSLSLIPRKQERKYQNFNLKPIFYNNHKNNHRHKSMNQIRIPANFTKQISFIIL